MEPLPNDVVQQTQVATPEFNGVFTTWARMAALLRLASLQGTPIANHLPAVDPTGYADSSPFSEAAMLPVATSTNSGD